MSASWGGDDKREARCDQPIAIAIVLVVGAVLAWLVWP